MASTQVENANPVIYQVNHSSSFLEDFSYNDEDLRDEVNPMEIFDMIRHINDPEHPLTLEQLNVVNLENIAVNDSENVVSILFTPTIPHCSMATLIGLCLQVKLLRALPRRFKISVRIFPGSHQSEEAINKQLNDKERVAAAMENLHLLEVVNKCIANSDK